MTVFRFFAGAPKRIIRFLRRGDKKAHELNYWEKRSVAEGGSLKPHDYREFYTTIFGLTDADYRGKRVLDIGCGPRGTLEWADETLQRVGLDPLACEYVKLRSRPHKMSYVAAASERMPFADAHFDVVTSFNSLDHVDDLRKTICEIKRVVKPEGLFLLMVEINHPPTPTEPITLRRELLDDFAPQFVIENSWNCALLPGKHDVYGSVRAKAAPNSAADKAILCAVMERTSRAV